MVHQARAVSVREVRLVDEFEPGASDQPDLFSADSAGSGGWWDDMVDPADDWDPRDVPDDTDAWLASLPDDIRAEVLAPRPAAWVAGGEALPAGFAAGGFFDTALPGPGLGQALASVTASGHAGLGEGELLGVLRGWQRQLSYAHAELVAAAIALAGRRAAGSPQAAEHLADEVAIELTLTGRSAGRLLDVVAGLRRLAVVHEALLSGVIDWAKACVFADELAVLADDAAALAIAGRLLDRAGQWTTGQLRAALVRAVLAADPGAAGRRQQAARGDSRVEVWAEPSGNAALAGRELRPAHVIAIDKQLTGYARWLQSCGVSGSVDQLRSLAYTTLLSGRELAAILADPSCWPEDVGGSSASADAGDAGGTRGVTGGAADGSAPDGSPAAAGDPAADTTGRASAGGDSREPASAGPDSRDGASGEADLPPGRCGDGSASDVRGEADLVAGGGGAAAPRVTGTVHLTMPVSAWLGGGEPGEVGGHGPVDAATSRELAGMLARDAGTRWCLTLTSPTGMAVGHACAGHGRGPAPGEPVVRRAAALREKMQLLEAGACSHARGSPGYTPPAALRHLIEVRQRTCSAPGCRRPARRCDLDHTAPYDQGGLTCECNLSPLCRRHHRAKQAPGWHLDQPAPGVMTWRLPSGREYQTTGEPYAV